MNVTVNRVLLDERPADWKRDRGGRFASTAYRERRAVELMRPLVRDPELGAPTKSGRPTTLWHAPPGVWWYDAPLPGLFHTCRPWTVRRGPGYRGAVGRVMVQVCACGGFRRRPRPGDPWAFKNSRRKNWQTGVAGGVPAASCSTCGHTGHMHRFAYPMVCLECRGNRCVPAATR